MINTITTIQLVQAGSTCGLYTVSLLLDVNMESVFEFSTGADNGISQVIYKPIFLVFLPGMMQVCALYLHQTTGFLSCIILRTGE